MAPLYTPLPCPKAQDCTSSAPPNSSLQSKRHPKALDFAPVGVNFAMSLSGSSDEGKKIAAHNINGEDVDYGLSMDFNKVVYPSLSSGKPLEAMYESIIPQIAASLEKLRAHDLRKI